jgi:hypothetical protein
MSGPRQPGAAPANLHNPDYLTQHPPPQRVVPRAERADRATLVRIAESYFDALSAHDRTVALVHEGCGRAENGSPTPRNALSEWFVIDDAKIRTVYTSMFYPPADLPIPYWPPYTGNWPLPAEIVPEAQP